MRNSISKACVGLAFLCMTPATVRFWHKADTTTDALHVRF